MAERADIKKGPIFRAIDRWEAVEERALTLQSVSGIVKQGCDMAEREAEAFFAPGLRDGYLTGAARQGIGLPEAMQQPQHRSVQMPRATTPKPNAPRGGRLASMMQRTE
jgi:hypothetical protein